MDLQLATERKQPRISAGGIESLRAVDWSFTRRKQQHALEALHPYPAKFIPELPGTLLDLLPIDPGTSVLDPFAGSGTTIVECQRRGISSVGVDLNPIACLISRVKTSEVPLGISRAIHDVITFAANAKDVAIPSIPNLDHWFEREIQSSLAGLLLAIHQCELQYHDILKLALSSIVVRVSNQDSDTRYAAVKKNISSKQVASLFAVACERIVAALRERSYRLAPANILERDTLGLNPTELGAPIGAVITSPPYPNAYEYWLYHKYRMWWLDYDPLAVKEREIGARAHFFKTNRHTADHFAEQMRRTFGLISGVLCDSGYACFVVGRSKIHGLIVDNASMIENAALECGFNLEFRAERVIAANRKSFNLSHANIKTETLLVFRRRST